MHTQLVTPTWVDYARRPGARQWLPMLVIEQYDNTISGWVFNPNGRPPKWITQAWVEDDPALTQNTTTQKLLMADDTGVYRLGALANLLQRLPEILFMLDERKLELDRKAREAVPFVRRGRPPKQQEAELATTE